MRMNGSCAGGTGAFIDEIASVLNLSIEEFDQMAAKGDCVYDVSGRCGVYAKTDIQPLLNQGVSKGKPCAFRLPCDCKADHRRTGTGPGDQKSCSF